MAGAITMAGAIVTGAIITIGETSLPSGDYSGRSRLSPAAFSDIEKGAALASRPSVNEIAEQRGRDFWFWHEPDQLGWSDDVRSSG